MTNTMKSTNDRTGRQRQSSIKPAEEVTLSVDELEERIAPSACPARRARTSSGAERQSRGSRPPARTLDWVMSSAMRTPSWRAAVDSLKH